MASLDSLATEILLVILIEIPSTQDLRSLRLVSRSLDSVVGPFLFSSLAFDIHKGSISQGTSLIQYLAKNPKVAFAGWVRSLVITNLDPSYEMSRSMSGYVKIQDDVLKNARDQILGSLGHAIRALVNVTSVRWKISTREPKWTHVAVPEALSTLPHLSEIVIEPTHVFFFSPLPFDKLSGIRSLSITASFNSRNENVWRDLLDPLIAAIRRSPEQLESLHLDVMIVGKETIRLGEFLGKCGQPQRNEDEESNKTPLSATKLGLRQLTLEHVDPSLTTDDLQHLQSLTVVELLTASAQPASTSNFFSVLLLSNHPICLSKLSVHTVDRTLLSYLNSYSGLESLKISSCPSPIRATTRSSSDDGEADKLARLFYTNVLPKHAPTLVELELAVTKESAWSFSKENVNKFRLCGRLRRLAVGINASDIGSAGEKEDITNTLLTTTLLMQDLHHLTILIAYPNPKPGSSLSGATLTSKHIILTKLYENIGELRHHIRHRGDTFTMSDPEFFTAMEFSPPRYQRKIYCPGGHTFDLVKTYTSDDETTGEQTEVEENDPDQNEEANEEETEVQHLELRYQEIHSHPRLMNYSTINQIRLIPLLPQYT
ncbi:hypothetical protein VKT23_010058 [Stygiomarasmius scandens]|uniref:F-box domain-containing protein n=1 Tax=Marasmiellus scandens TaxID=2682957 RepID=A0ABR1JFN2_9AGAR